MSIFTQLDKDMDKHLGSIKSEAKPYTQAELDHAQGIEDCEKGIPNKNTSPAYNEGYMFQTAYQISVEASE